MPKTYFEQFIEYRLMDFKFTTVGHDTNGLNTLLEEHLLNLNSDSFKQVCAKLPVQLVEKLDGTIGKLEMSKRRFIELALIEAIAKVDKLEDEINIFEFVNQAENP